MIKIFLFTSIVILGLLTGCESSRPAPRAEAVLPTKKLGVGDFAPAYNVDTYVIGMPVQEPQVDITKNETYKTDHVYVIEFTATWCGPCMAAIDHLSELQVKNRKSLVIIGIAAVEQPTLASFDEKLQHLTEVLNKHQNPIRYNIVFDNSGISWRNWMTASEHSAIPTAFIVSRERKIVFIGHPDTTEFDQALERELNK